MKKRSMASRKRALFMLLGAVAGPLGGIVLGRVLAQQFPGAPPWLLPAIVIGAIALALVAVLTLPAALRSRRRKQERGNGPP